MSLSANSFLYDRSFLKPLSWFNLDWKESRIESWRPLVDWQVHYCHLDRDAVLIAVMGAPATCIVATFQPVFWPPFEQLNLYSVKQSWGPNWSNKPVVRMMNDWSVRIALIIRRRTAKLSLLTHVPPTRLDSFCRAWTSSAFLWKSDFWRLSRKRTPVIIQRYRCLNTLSFYYFIQKSRSTSFSLSLLTKSNLQPFAHLHNKRPAIINYYPPWPQTTLSRRVVQMLSRSRSTCPRWANQQARRHHWNATTEVLSKSSKI